MSVRQIVLDTETTGLDPLSGHRIIEIGAIEMVNRRLTGTQFHRYLNPERLVDAGAMAVHGLNNQFLADKPLFADVVAEFLSFIEGAELIIHNAPFDIKFIEHEFRLAMVESPTIASRASVIDTLVMARKMHPGQKNSLDALCKRYKVSNSHRSLHGALLDADILAKVYLAMTGGQKSILLGDTDSLDPVLTVTQAQRESNHAARQLISYGVSLAEQQEHEKWLAMLNKK